MIRRALVLAVLTLVLFAPSGCGKKPAGEGNAKPPRPIRPDPPGPPPEGMVLVAGGSYSIGSDSGDADEQPVHRVTLDPFYIDAREVTNAEFARFVAESDYKTEGEWRRFAGNGRESHPVVSVTWKDASAYAGWAGKRLPTETEWEVAARGGRDGKRYPNGDVMLENEANFGHVYEDVDVKTLTTSVGSHPANGYGLYDMAGNVWEWCSDYYAPDAYKRSDEHNPQGPERGACRVIRGGSWNDWPESARVSNRLEMTPAMLGAVFGFRCAKTPEE